MGIPDVLPKGRERRGGGNDGGGGLQGGLQGFLGDAKGRGLEGEEEGKKRESNTESCLYLYLSRDE